MCWNSQKHTSGYRRTDEGTRRIKLKNKSALTNHQTEEEENTEKKSRSVSRQRQHCENRLLLVVAL